MGLLISPPLGVLRDIRSRGTSQGFPQTEASSSLLSLLELKSTRKTRGASGIKKELKWNGSLFFQPCSKRRNSSFISSALTKTEKAHDDQDHLQVHHLLPLTHLQTAARARALRHTAPHFLLVVARKQTSSLFIIFSSCDGFGVLRSEFWFGSRSRTERLVQHCSV